MQTLAGANGDASKQVMFMNQPVQPCCLQDTDVMLAQLTADGAASGGLLSSWLSPPPADASTELTALFSNGGTGITPSMVAGLQGAAHSSGSFQSLLNGDSMQRQPDASVPEVAQQAATSSGDLRHTSSGDTSLRTALHSNSGDDAETAHKVMA
jgi:hypothetical protein